jgi:two-component system NarL family sensor kinase
MKLKSLTILGAVEEKAGNINRAFYYQKERLVLKDTLEKEDVQKKVRELDAQYQSGLKDSRIEQMNKEKEIDKLEGEKKSLLIYVLTGGLAAIVLIGFISYRGFRSKQNLAKQTEALQLQRIKELELEKQLIAYNGLLKGQEEERSRMAKDLHDGLGGMLSSVKLTLGAMKGNTILTEDNTRLFSKALDQLDHSINEMRRVAHNMMPEALVKFGLQQAIEDYCNGLREGSTLKFNAQFHGLEKRMDGPTEIIVYRIIQELLNNVVKHAKATEVLVQVMRHGNNLNITVEDNGLGVPDSVDSKKGAGLVNVQARVDYLKGTMDVQSIAGKGTSIHIDCTISDL